MENENVMDFKGIRAKARQNLSGKWGLSIGVAAVAALLGGLITGNSFLPELEKKFEMEPGWSIGLDHQLMTAIMAAVLSISLVVIIAAIAISIVSGAVELGYAQFLLKQHDGKDIAFRDLFSQFYRFGQGFAQHFLRSLYVFLWMLLLIVPGIIKAYSYAMTPFIMADHPELSASEAITRSKEMMVGHKLELFVLDLTFIGWVILCALTMNLGYLFLNPYTNAAYAVFYRQISGQQRYIDV